MSFRPAGRGPRDRVRAVADGHALLREVVRSGQNREVGGALVFDGLLAGVGGSYCLILNNDETPRPGPGPTNPSFYERVPCGEPLPEDGKYIAIQAFYI